MSSSRRRFLSVGWMALAGLGWISKSQEFFFHTVRRSLPGGFWPVMITPFKEDLSIDFDKLTELIRWYEKSGAAGLFANCGSSEMYHLSDEERLDLTEFVVKKSKLPVVSSGTFSHDTAANVSFIREIYATGVKAVILISPMLVPQEEDEAKLMEAVRKTLEDTQDIPLGIYESPGPYQRLISPEALRQINQMGQGRFLFFKDTSCDKSVVRRKMKAISGSSFGLYNAYAPDALDTLRNGGAGMAVIAGNFYPELFSYIWKNGRSAEVSETVSEVNRFIIENDPVISRKYLLAVRYFMNLRGLAIHEKCRSGVQPLDQSEKKELDRVWEKLKKLSADHQIDLV